MSERGDEWLTRSNLMGSCFGATQERRNEIINAITRLAAITPGEVYNLCISKFGSQFTETYPTDVTFTMPTGIHSIMILTTWCVSLLWSIAESISITPNVSHALERILQPYVHWQAPGIGLILAELGIAKTPSALGQSVNQTNQPVLNAPLGLIRFFQNALSFALTHANQDGGEDLELIKKYANVNGVKKNSNAISTTRRDFAPVRVVSVIGENKKMDTYALNVFGAHEFFANGVLAKNCYDTLRYLLMEISNLVKTGVMVH